MQASGPVMRRLSTVRRELLRGDSWFAVLIFAVVSVFLFGLVASGWDHVMSRSDARKETKVQHLRAVGTVLARVSETLMATDELPMLQDVLVEAGREHELTTCRIVLPGGGVLADADPAGITASQLPLSWASEPSRVTEQLGHSTATLTFPLVVSDRGSATLEIAGALYTGLGADFIPQTAQMAIACLALASMLLVHRHARFRLKAIGAIHEILLAVTDENADLATLELDPRLGLETAGWNKLLGARQSTQICSAIQHVKEAAHEKSDTAGVLRAAFGAAPCGLVLVNDRMEVEHVNGAAAALLHKEPGRMMYVDVSSVLADAQVLAAIRDVVTGAASRARVITTEQAGSATMSVLRFTVSPVRHDGARSGLIAIQGVTQPQVVDAR